MKLNLKPQQHVCEECFFPVVSWAFIAGHSMFCGPMGVSNFSWLYQHQCRYVLSDSIHFWSSPLRVFISMFFFRILIKKSGFERELGLMSCNDQNKKLHSSGWKLIQVPLLMDKPTKIVVLMSVDNIHLNSHPGDIPKQIFPIDQQKKIFLEFTIQYSILLNMPLYQNINHVNNIDIYIIMFTVTIYYILCV